MESIKLSIPGMKSLHCQMTVANAIKGAGGSIVNLEATVAHVNVADGVTKEAIIAAVSKAGYQVSRHDQRINIESL